MGRGRKGDAAGEDGGRKKRGVLLPAVIVAAALLGAAYMVSGGPGGEAAVADPAASTTTTIVEGPVVALDPITLNLAGGHFLKAGLAIQLTEEGAALAEGTDTRATFAEALDEAIQVLGGRPYEDLADPAGRERARGELLERVRARYDDQVLGIYFTEFVMQ